MNEALQVIALLAGIVASVVASAASVVAVLTYVRSRRETAFLTTSSDYLAFLAFCLERPELDLFEVGRSEVGDLAWRRLVGFEYLFQVLERAHYLYGDQSTPFRARQWQGWADWTEYWSREPAFREAWIRLRNTDQFDRTFGAFVEELMARHEPRAGRTLDG